MTSSTETRMKRVGGLAGILFFAPVAVAVVLSSGGPSAEDGQSTIDSSGLAAATVRPEPATA
jgi:hypothetical protein